MKKLAYFMHIDWNWIKQRPHFLAEKLSDHYEIDLYYIHHPGKTRLTQNHLDKNKFENVCKILKLPLSSRVRWINRVENIWNWNNLRQIYTKSFDYIWITNPIWLQFINIKRLLPISRRIIYDCMDDISGFPLPTASRQNLLQLEQELLFHSNLVFASSERLANILRERQYSGFVQVVNNGIELSAFKKNSRTISVQKTQGLYNIVYFGTISQWFDIELIQKLLLVHSDIKFTIIGPADIELPTHPRIVLKGPLPHSDLVSFASTADAFIMPFIVNDLIKSVDPVKVYEYIFYNKPTFVVKYEETAKFKEHVSLYSTFDELSSLISYFKQHSEHRDSSLNLVFLESNTWDNRAKKIQFYLEHQKYE